MVLPHLPSTRASSGSKVEEHCEGSAAPVKSFTAMRMCASANTAARFIPANDDAGHRYPQSLFPRAPGRTWLSVGTPNWPWIERLRTGQGGDHGRRPFLRRVLVVVLDPEVRMQEMDRDHVDFQVISATPVLFCFQRPFSALRLRAGLLNDAAALDLCHRGKDHLELALPGAASRRAAACKELSRCMRAGHVGVGLAITWATESGQPGIVTFFSRSQIRRAPVIRHPWDMMSPLRMPNFLMPWTVAMPAETGGVVSLILSGAMDGLPATFRICFAHGGGSYFLLGRLENAWHLASGCPWKM